MIAVAGFYRRLEPCLQAAPALPRCLVCMARLEGPAWHGHEMATSDLHRPLIFAADAYANKTPIYSIILSKLVGDCLAVAGQFAQVCMRTTRLTTRETHALFSGCPALFPLQHSHWPLHPAFWNLSKQYYKVSLVFLASSWRGLNFSRTSMVLHFCWAKLPCTGSFRYRLIEIGRIAWKARWRQGTGPPDIPGA